MAIHVRDRRGGEWWWAHNAIITEHGAALGAYGIAVYAALCCHAGDEGVTWIGQKNLAAEIGCSRAQVQKELAKLRAMGLVEIEEQSNEHGQTTNTYSLLPVELPRLRDGRGSHHVGTMATTAKAPPARTVGTMNKTQRKRLTEQELLELENRSIAESRVQS